MISFQGHSEYWTGGIRDARRPRTAANQREIARHFRGGPLFDTNGNLAALELPFGAAAASSVLRLLEQE